MEKYLQTAKLTIGSPIPRILTLKSVANPDGIDFDFTITRKKYVKFAEINVTLYNINEKTFIAATKEHPTERFHNIAPIKCEAGYQGNNKVIFSGTIFRVQTMFTPGEKITTLTVSNFSDNINSKVIRKSYKKAPKLSQALDDLGREAGVVMNLTNLAPEDDRSIGTTAFVGQLAGFLDREATHNINISYEYGVETFDTVIVRSNNQLISKVPIEILTAKNGMIMAPTTTDKNLIKVQALFNPDYLVDKFIRVESQDFHQNVVQGTIFSVTHTFLHTGSISTIEILPEGRKIPRGNMGVGP